MPGVPLTEENLKAAVKDFEARFNQRIEELLKQVPKINGVVTPEQLQEFFKTEGEKLKKDVMAMVPAQLRDEIKEALRPQDVERRQANKAIRWALTHKISEVVGDQDLEKEAQEAGLLIMDPARRIAMGYGNKKALSAATGDSMGFLIPTQARGPIIELERKQSIMATICPVMDNPPPRWTQPREKGGITFYWGNENAATTASDPTLDLLIFSLSDVYGLVEISNMLLQWTDFDITGYISRLYARDLAVELDSKFVAGDGSGEPQGLLEATGHATANQAAAHFDWKDVNTIYHGINAKYRRRAVWMAEDSVIEGIEDIPDSVGGPLFFDLSNPNVRGIGNISADDPMVQGFIRRRPLYEQKDVPTDTVAFFVPDFYEIGSGAIEIASSEDANFAKNQTVMRMVHFVEGKPTMPESIVLMEDVVL